MTMHHTASCGAGHSQSARRFPRFVTKSGLIRTFRQQNPASNEFLVLNALKLKNSIPPCQICTRDDGPKLLDNCLTIETISSIRAEAVALTVDVVDILSAAGVRFPGTTLPGVDLAGYMKKHRD